MSAVPAAVGRITLCWVGWFFILAAAGWVPVGWAADESETRTRVSMMDFTSDDGLMRSADGAAQCSALTQDNLARQEPGIDWIERAELQNATDELNLSAGGFTNADASLRVGKWLKADLAILGRFTRNEKDEDGHTLRLEVVDLCRADTLATRIIHVDGDRRDAITADPVLVPSIASALHEALVEARAKLARTARQVVIAPLFFQSTDTSPRLDSFGSMLLDAFFRSADRAGDVRILRFPQADQARNESELVVSGLAEGEADAWQRVAGWYVWGSYRELPAPGKTFAQTPVEIELTTWDGACPARSFKEQTVVAELPAFSQRLAEQCLDAARHAPTARPDAAAVRGEIACSLCEQGKRLTEAIASHGTQRTAFLDTPMGKRVMQQQRLFLDTACFFAPESREAQLARLQARWDGFPSPIQRLPLLDLWRRSNDLADYADRFGGPDTDLPFVRVHADQYMVGRLHDGEAQMHVTGSEPNLPVDATAANLAAWHAALDERFARDTEVYARTAAKQPSWDDERMRLAAYVNWMHAALKSMHDPAHAARVVEAVWPLYEPLHEKYPVEAERDYGTLDGGLAADLPSLYERLGKPGRAAAILASLSSGASAHPMNIDPTPPPVAAARLPRLKPAAAAFSIGEPEPSSSFNPNAERYLVNNLTVATNDQLWLSIGHVGGKQENGAPRAPTQELWRFDPALQDMESLAFEGLTFQTAITAILPRPEGLWLGVDLHGVAQYDADKEKATRRYTIADGLVSDNVDDIAATDDGRLYFAGHENDRPLLGSFDPARQEWSRIALPSFPHRAVLEDLPPALNAKLMLPPSAQVVIFKHWLLLGTGNDWAVVDTRQASAKPLREFLLPELRQCLDAPSTIVDAKAKGRMPYAGSPPRCPRPCAVDAGGYWLAVGRTLLRFDPAHPEMSRSFPLPDEYADGLTCLASDGDNVWSLGMLDPVMAADQVAKPGYAFSAVTGIVTASPRTFVAVMRAADGRWRGGFEMPGIPGALALSRQSLYVGLQMAPQPIVEINKTATLASIPR